MLVAFALLSVAVAGPALPDPTAREGGMQVNNPEVVTAVPVNADAASLTIDALIPAEVLIDGVKLAQLWAPATLTLSVPSGSHLLRVYTYGKPTDQLITTDPVHDLRVVVSRTGLTVDAMAIADDDATHVPVEFRMVTGHGATIRLDGERHRLAAGDRLDLDLTKGAHDLSVRSGDGTVIWATGKLMVESGAPVVIHLAEGRMPEVSGAATFDNGAGG